MVFCACRIERLLGLYRGVADTLASGASIHGWRACFKEGVDAAHLQAVTLHFLEGHGDDWKQSAASLVAAAFAEGFPCEDEPASTPRREE